MIATLARHDASGTSWQSACPGDEPCLHGSDVTGTRVRPVMGHQREPGRSYGRWQNPWPGPATPEAARASPMSRRRSAPVAPIAGIAAPPMSQPGPHRVRQRGPARQAWRSDLPHAPAHRVPLHLRIPSRLPIGSLRPKSRRSGDSTPLPLGRYAGCPGAQALPLAGVGGSVLACRPSSQSGADVATTLL